MIAAALIGYGLVRDLPLAIFGVAFFGSPLVNLLTIKWMDQHGDWGSLE